MVESLEITRNPAEKKRNISFKLLNDSTRWISPGWPVLLFGGKSAVPRFAHLELFTMYRPQAGFRMDNSSTPAMCPEPSEGQSHYTKTPRGVRHDQLRSAVVTHLPRKREVLGPSPGLGGLD